MLIILASLVLRLRHNHVLALTTSNPPTTPINHPILATATPLSHPISNMPSPLIPCGTLTFPSFEPDRGTAGLASAVRKLERMSGLWMVRVGGR
jgi:hypothetical protein